MLFTWDTSNLCIVFSQWRVTGTFSLVISILAVMALTAGYEAIREMSRSYEARQAERIESAPRKSDPVLSYSLYATRCTLPFLTRQSSGRENCKGRKRNKTIHPLIQQVKKKTRKLMLDQTSVRKANPSIAVGEQSSLLWMTAGNTAEAEEKKGKIVKAALYGIQVFYSFFIM